MSTPAGWYPDPSATDPTRSRLRWWDGAAWTEHVHSSPQAPQQSPAPSLTKTPPAPDAANPYAPPHQQQTYQPSPYEQANQYAQYPQYPPSQYPAPGVKAIATPDGQALAGLGFRLLARIVDWVLVGIIGSVAGWSSLRTLNNQMTAVSEAFVAGDSERAVSLMSDLTRSGVANELTLVLLAVSAVYTILSIRFYGATPGKALCRIRVRAWDRPGNPRWGQSIVRWVGGDLLGQMFLGIFLLIDSLWPLWDQRKQALHDKLARTVVVKR